MLKRLLSIVLTATIILSAFTAFPVSVNAEEATEPTDSAETYSPTEDDSTVTIPTEPATELESEKETEPITEQPFADPIATESPTENKEDSFNTIEKHSKHELASTGANGETYEQAARYVPNYVITGSNTIQSLYNPYTAQMLLDLSLDAYQVIDPDYSEGWQRTLIELGYTTRIATAGSTTYAVGEISNGDGVPSTPITLGNFHAIIGIKRVMYNDQEKYALVIAFRGTKSIQDLVGTDFNFLPTAEGFHSGFRNCSKDFLYYFKNTSFSINGETITGEEILNSMKTENSKYSVLVTGHSLGGAMADVFVGYDLYEMGVHPSNVMAYTFAAPTSAPSYYNYPYKNIINIINEDDFVPTVGASKRVGTDFCYTPDDAFRQAHYKNHYEEGHGTAWWSNIVNEAFHFVSHDLDKVYNPIIVYFQNHIDNYTSYHTNGDNTWKTSVRIIPSCYNTFIGNISVYDLAICDGTLSAETITQNNQSYNLTLTNGIISAKNITANGSVNINGTNHVDGDMDLRGVSFNQGGQLKVTGDFSYSYMNMRNEDNYLLVYGTFSPKGANYSYFYTYPALSEGVIELKGDFVQNNKVSTNTYYTSSGNHQTIFSGDSNQSITMEYPDQNAFSTIIIENSSSGGITFNSRISVAKLFDHKGNEFALYNGGLGSTFVDYDGDGMLDHVDPYPTDPNNTPPTQESTQPSTQEPTQLPTQEPTQPPTQEPTQPPTQEPSNSPMLLGDVDGDGTVTIIDATCIQRHLASIPTFAFIEALADTDGDGETTILDATFIQRWLANLPSNDNIGKPIK